MGINHEESKFIYNGPVINLIKIFNHLTTLFTITYFFCWVNVNLGEEQLVTVFVLSCPLSNHIFDIFKVTNET